MAKAKQSEALTTTEATKVRKALQQLEERFEKAEESRVDALNKLGTILHEINEKKLYRADYKTFEEYCSTRWGYTRRHAYRLIEGDKVAKNLGHNVTKPPAKQAQKLALAEAPEGEQVEVWELTQTSTGKEQPSASEIKATIASRVAPAVETEGEDERSSVDGSAIDAKIDAAFDIGSRLKAKQNAIRALKREVMADLEALGLGDDSVFDDLISRSADYLSAVWPHQVCCYCQGEDPDCTACKGKGWLSEGAYNSAPAELRGE